MTTLHAMASKGYHSTHRVINVARVLHKIVQPYINREGRNTYMASPQG